MENNKGIVLYSGSHSCGEENHYFIGRWDHIPLAAGVISASYGEHDSEILALTRAKYICDICRYCGEIRNIPARLINKAGDKVGTK